MTPHRPLRTSILAVAAAAACLVAGNSARAAIIFTAPTDNGGGIATSDSVTFTSGSGTVTVDDVNLDIGPITYSATSGVYTIDNSTLGTNFTGAITNLSGSTQLITNNLDATFTNSVVSGGLGITNTASSTIAFTGASTGGSGVTVDNSGALDVSNVTTPITLGSVTQNTGSGLGINAASLSLSTLTLTGDNTITFNAGSGHIEATTLSITGGLTTISLVTVPNVAGSYELIGFNTSPGADLGDFALFIDQPTEYSASLSLVNGDGLYLNLVAIPEVSSAWIPLLGAAGLLAYRRRSARSEAVLA